jgi:CHAT domain-containing protein/Tfp pilus assembly protein PilF
MGVALCCAAGAAFAVEPPAQGAAPRATSGEVFGWKPAARGRNAPADATDARRYEAQVALERATAAQAGGLYVEAVAAGEHALAALESAPDVPPKELARYLVLVGEWQWLAGDLALAELRLKRGLAILETALGTSHPDVSAARNKLAIVYQAEGFAGRAEPLHRRALAMQEAILGAEHPDVATSLNNLAILYKSQGMYERAEPLYQRALAIREKALGKDHPEVASSLGNLAALYEAQGLHARAEELLHRALGLQEKALGAGHPDVAVSLSDLAGVYVAQGQAQKAEPLMQRALAIRRAALGESHPAVAASLAELAALALAQGDAAKAAPFAQRALAIREAALGAGHPDVAASLEMTARVHLAQGQLDEALPLLQRSLALSEARLRRESLDFSELRLATFLQLLRSGEERLYSLLRAHPEDARVQRLALAAALLRKGRSVEELANTSRAVYRSLALADRDAFERLRALRSQLARETLSGPGPLGAAPYQRRLKELEDQGDALEAKLARGSSRLRALTVLPGPSEIVDEVAAALPADGALLELVTYADREPGEAAVGPGALRDVALVLAPGGRIGAVDLGPAGPINEAVSRLRDALASRDAEYEAPARALEALVFEPLRPLLGEARRLFVSPDGQLSLVPFAALHDGKRFLVDAYEITYLTSGRDLLPRPADAARSRSVVVLADPDFGARPDAAPVEQRTVAERDYALPPPRPPVARADLRSEAWMPLPGTRQEAESLRALFPKAQVFIGAEATKERLLHVAAPGILHVATHGFFLEDESGAPGGARGVGVVGGPAGPARPPSRATNPLLRSGLVLAGAASAGSSQVRLDTALVTALELAGADLWGTQLVVLSACDTGRGDVRLGQGVYGLRRALVAAGAETVVMSLWKVDDETTRALMESYYRNLLAGKGRTAALGAAMQELRAARPHPYFWAPFISSGNDAPLVLGDE